MKKKFSLFLSCSASVFFYSCSTDFSTIGPYKETMILYGLLNPTDSIQYIRISKAYLGEGNTLIMAQQKDSINYAHVLDVKIEKLMNGVVTSTVTLDTTTAIPKSSGTFYSPYQVLYTYMARIANDDGATYRITARNTQSGLTVTSETGIVGAVDFDSPPLSLDFTSQYYTSIKLLPSTNAWIYNFTMRFHYKEVNLISGDTVSKYVDWNFGDAATGASGSGGATYDGIYRPDLYRIIGYAVAPADTNVTRRIIDSPPIELIGTAGTQDLYTYQQLTQPSYGIVQERPVFSNIVNGIGLFTGRTTKTIPRSFDPAGHSRAAFDTSRYTHNLFFH